MKLSSKSLGLAAITLLALPMALSACSSSGSDSGGPTTITFWNGFTASDRPVVEEIVDNFNSSQKDYTIDMTVQPWDVFYQKLLPAYSAGEGPTLAGFNALYFPGYSSKGVLEPTDDFLAGWKDSGSLREDAVQATMYDGKNYGVPMSAASSMLYYNKTLLAEAGITEPPATLDELADAAVKLTKYDEGNPSNSVYGLAIPDHAAISTWTAFMQANGGGVVNDDGTKSLFDSPESIDTITKWTDLVKNDHISPVNLGGVEGDNLFTAGKAAMYINGPWASTGFTEAGIDFGLATVPEGTVKQTATLDSNNFGISAEATDEEKAGAEAFITFWNSTDQQLVWALGTGNAPTRTDITADQLAENPNSVAFSKAQSAQLSLPALVDFQQIDSEVLTPTIQRVLNGEGTAEDLMTEGSKQITSLMQ